MICVDYSQSMQFLQQLFLEEDPAEVDGLGRFVGVDADRLAVLVHLAATVRPEQRVEPAVDVAEAVTQLEPQGVALLLEQAPGPQQALPGVGQLREPGLTEPVRAAYPP